MGEEEVGEGHPLGEEVGHLLGVGEDEEEEREVEEESPAPEDLRLEG